MNTDALRAAVILVLTNAVSVAVLLNLVSWNPDQVAGVVAFVNSTVTLLFLVWKVKPNTTTEISLETRRSDNG